MTGGDKTSESGLFSKKNIAFIVAKDSPNNTAAFIRLYRIQEDYQGNVTLSLTLWSEYPPNFKTYFETEAEAIIYATLTWPDYPILVTDPIDVGSYMYYGRNMECRKRNLKLIKTGRFHLKDIPIGDDNWEGLTHV